MAYLPGERPLTYPWQNQGVIEGMNGKERPRSGFRNVNIALDITGPGSAYVEWGSGSSSTKLIAVVKGPRQQSVTRSAFDVDVSFAPFANITTDPNELSRDLAAYIKEGIEGSLSLELYPYSAVTIYIKVLQCGRSIHSMLSPSIIASMAACKQAGIQIKDQVVSVAIAVSKTGDFVVDPDDQICDDWPCASIGLTVESRQMTVFHLTGMIARIDMIDSLVNVADGSVNQLWTLITDRTH